MSFDYNNAAWNKKNKFLDIHINFNKAIYSFKLIENFKKMRKIALKKIINRDIYHKNSKKAD